MNHKPLAYLLMVLISASLANAWLDDTHKWICSQAGLSQYDCTIADNIEYQKEHNGTTSKYHLCINDTDSCAARTWAKKLFAANPEAAIHLWSDSKAPSHWHNFGSEGCHLDFEDCVNSNLRFGNTNWSCSFECTDLLERQKYKVSADYKYMLEVVDYTKQQFDASKNKRIVAYCAAIFAILLLAAIFIALRKRKTDGRSRARKRN